MCKGPNEPGGPQRCDGETSIRAQNAQAALQECTCEVNALSSEITDIDQMLNDLHDALNGTLTADRERELLDQLDAGTDGDDAPDRGDAAPDSWDQRVQTALAAVDTSWNDVVVTGPVFSGNETLEDFERKSDPAQYRAACAAYEKAVLQAGAVIGERADALIAERLADAPPEAPRIASSDVDAMLRNLDRRDPEAIARYNKLATDFNAQAFIVREHDLIRAQAYRDILNEVRPLGGAMANLGGKRPNKELVGQVRAVSDDVPAEWTTMINDVSEPLTLKRHKAQRGHYVHETQEIQTRGNLSTMYHELGHRMEHHIPQISVATNEFLRRRTTHDDGTRHPEVGFGRSRSSDERVRPDGFAHQYVGKTYPPPATEVFSTGMEAIFSGSFGGLTGVQRSDDHPKADVEHRNLMLGLYATALNGRQNTIDHRAHEISMMQVSKKGARN